MPPLMDELKKLCVVDFPKELSLNNPGLTFPFLKKLVNEFSVAIKISTLRNLKTPCNQADPFLILIS